MPGIAAAPVPSALRVHDPPIVGAALPHGAPLPESDPALSVDELRLTGSISYDANRMRNASQWISFFTSAFRLQITSGTSTPAASVGERLVSTVVAHCQTVYSTRRRLLRGNAEFLGRLRDPLPANGSHSQAASEPDAGQTGRSGRGRRRAGAASSPPKASVASSPPKASVSRKSRPCSDTDSDGDDSLSMQLDSDDSDSDSSESDFDYFDEQYQQDWPD